MAHILLIEDNQDFAHFVCAVLPLVGHRVAHAPTLQAGLRLVRQVPPPDLVLLDLTLPDGTGLDFLDQTGREWPVVALTADIGNDLRDQLQARSVRYVTKPLSARELIDLVTTTLAKGHAHEHTADPDRR